MKKMIGKIILLLALTVLCLSGIVGVRMILIENGTTLARDVFHARKKAQLQNDCTIVYLGDSVCKQLWDEFDEDVDGICHIGCNQAITPAGSYLLLKEYLDNHPQTKQAYYLICPQTLSNDIGLKHSYPYFVIPFLDEENRVLLEPETMDMVNTKFGKFFVENSMVKKLLLNSKLLMRTYLDQVKKQGEVQKNRRISRTGEIYLAKMRQLCEERGVELIVKSNPLADTQENRQWEEYRNDIKRCGFEDILGNYIDEITYYPEDWFIDGVHFKEEILAKYGEKIRESVLKPEMK